MRHSVCAFFLGGFVGLWLWRVFCWFLAMMEVVAVAGPGVFCGYLGWFVLRQAPSAHTEAIMDSCFEEICSSGD